MTAPRKKAPILVVSDSPLGQTPDRVSVWSADQYLEGQDGTLEANAVVVNLCRSYQYLSKGYYVSLLADARGQRAFPDLEMIEQISNPFAYFRALREEGLETIDFKVVGGRRLLPRVIVPEAGRPEVLEATHPSGDGRSERAVRYRQTHQPYVEVTSVLGKTHDRRFRKHAAAIFRIYSFPLLRIRMYREEDGWKIGQMFPVPLGQLTAEERERIFEQVSRGTFVKSPSVASRRRLHRIACLWDPKDEFAASDEDTLERLARVALRRGVLFDVISKDDLARLPEYDALFIRSVTGINHFSFTFAQRAASMGMPVIDDPQSIMKCSNKVYLHELFQREGIPAPKTTTVSRRTNLEEVAQWGFPLIVKLPQGSFSVSVKKADGMEQLQSLLNELFKDSPLLIVQEFRPTPFDWRVAVLEGRMLFICKYHQAKDHWQIARRFPSGFTRHGRVEAIANRSAPAAVRKLALSGAALIGDGLYGVDIKETASGPVIIEINDNPNLETTYEDGAEKDRIYEKIIDVFLRRIHKAARVAEKA